MYILYQCPFLMRQCSLHLRLSMNHPLPAEWPRPLHQTPPLPLPIQNKHWVQGWLELELTSLSDSSPSPSLLSSMIQAAWYSDVPAGTRLLSWLCLTFSSSVYHISHMTTGWRSHDLSHLWRPWCLHRLAKSAPPPWGQEQPHPINSPVIIIIIKSGIIGRTQSCLKSWTNDLKGGDFFGLMRFEYWKFIADWLRWGQGRQGGRQGKASTFRAARNIFNFNRVKVNRYQNI